MTSDFTPVCNHSITFFLRNVALNWLVFCFGHICMDTLSTAFLLMSESLEQLFKVKLELVSVALFCLLEGLNRNHMFAQAILHLLSQHELLFVELEEDLQVHEVLTVLLPLDICSIPINGQARLMVLGAFTLEDRLTRLMSLTVLDHAKYLLGI